MTTDEKIDAIYTMMLELAKGGAKSGGAKAAGGEVADAFDLDGQYGNEDIRKMPAAKYWSGDDFLGRKMSETSADFLDAFAKYKDACAYMNEKSGDESKAKYIGYDRRSAARARGWSKRLRDGWSAPAPVATQAEFAGDDSSGDIPF